MKISFPLTRMTAYAGTTFLLPEYAHTILMQLGVETLEGWTVSLAPASMLFNHSADTWGGGDYVLKLIGLTLRRNFMKQPVVSPDGAQRRWELVINDRQVFVELKISTGCKERAYYTKITIL